MIGAIQQYLDDAKMSLELAHSAIHTKLSELQPEDNIASTSLIDTAAEMANGLIACVRSRQHLNTALSPADHPFFTAQSPLALALGLILKNLETIYTKIKATLPPEVKRDHWQRAHYDPNAWLTTKERYAESSFEIDVLDKILLCKGQLESILSAERTKDLPPLKLAKMR